MQEDLSEQMHKTLYYKHVIVRDKGGRWVFFDQPIIFTLLNVSSATGVLEVTMRKALLDCPWIRVPFPGQPANQYDMLVVQAPTLEAFTLMDLEEIGRRHDNQTA